jgi:hypothetical protein
MLSKRLMIVASAVAFALPAVLATAARAQSESKLVEDWEKLAGSDANAKSLVNGLRDGKEVTLKSGSTTTTFTPPTGKMGNGSVNNALLLAQESLKQQGISNPTPDQLKSAVSGVLDQRAQHKGWGEIAKSMNVKLGDLRRNEHAQLARDRDRREDRAERHERAERPEKPERPDHAARGGR